MNQKFERTIDVKTASAKNGTIDLAISSEAPYERMFGIEILRHDSKSVDLSRLNDGRHPLLLNHNPDQQIGVMQKVWLGGDKKLRGRAKFSRSDLGEQIRQDVEDQVRSLVSVGYQILKIEEQKKNEDGELVTRQLTGEQFEREMRDQYGDTFYRSGPAACRAKGYEPPTYIVTRWLPFEASVVPIPADTSVGVGRSRAANIQSTRRITATHRGTKMENEITFDSPEKEIAALGEQYRKYVSERDTMRAISQGMSPEAFRDLVMKKIESKHTDSSLAYIGMTTDEVKRYSFGRALQAALTGDWKAAGFERECSQAMEKQFGRAAEGFFLPLDVMRRDFNVGTSSEAGNLVPTEFRGDMFVDVLRNAMVLGNMGVTMLAGLTSDVDLPRKSTASTLAMATEIGSASETNPNTAKVTLQPHRISNYIQVSKQAIIQSALPLEGMLRDDLIVGSAVLIEDQALNGNGTSPNMTGLRNASGIGTSTAGSNGGAPTWALMVGLETTAANANAEPDKMAGYVTNSKVRGKLKTTQQGTNLPFIWVPGDMPVNGYRVGVSNNVPSNLTKGTSTTVCSSAIFSSDWSKLALGLFGGPDVVVDPYTNADTGQVKITINQFADVGVRDPNCFTVIDDLLTT